MSFSDWTKKRQQQNGGASAAQQTGARATASSSAANIARDDKPSSFGEWTRKNQGVTAWRDEEVGFNQWLEQMSRFSSKAGSDYQSRVDSYQSADDITKYRDDTYRSLDALSKTGQDYRTYFQAYKSMYDEMYGAETTQQILSALDEGSKYLDSLRGGVDSAYNFWSQFQDEDDYNTYKKGQEYAALADAADFAEKSQYVSTYQPGTEKFNAFSGTYTNSGFGDINYDYINRDETARSRQMLSDIQSNASLLGLDNSERGEMTDDEIAIFNYLYAQDTANGDTEHSNAYAYIDYLTKDLNYRQRAKAEEEWAAYANEHPVGSSVFSVLESPLKGISYLGQFADYTADGKIDQNEGYNKFSYINSAIRNEVNTIVEDKWGGVGSFAYQTGMSMGDFLFNTAITGGNQALTLAIMGTGAAADTTISAKDRGLSDNQAFALGTIAGAAEIITEKVSLDALLDKTSLTKNAMGYFLKNTLAEGSEEVGSDIINLVSDVLISKDKSEWQQSINAYQSEGMDENEAFWHAVRDQAESMGLDFLGGAVSGGVMSGAGIAVNSGLNEYSARQTGAEFNAMGDDVVLATIQEGLASDPSTRSYQLAQQLQQKLDNGETITNAELGRLYQANVQAIDAEDASGDILLRAADEVARNGRVTNSTATDILDNPSAMNTLAQEAGLSVTEDMSKAQQRKAVKTAVEGLARARETAAGETVTTATSQQEKAAETAQVRPAAQQVHDIKRMQQAASALGENGAKALNTVYDGNAASDSFYAGFVAYYEAGVSGMDMSKVRSEYSAQLNQAQKFAAYVAGQNDAEVSLARERLAAQYAKVAGTDSGLVFDDYVASSMDTATADRVNSIAKALGVRVRFVDSVRGGTANAQVSGSDILVEKNNPNPVMFLLGHEWTHRMQELAPDQYRAFRDAVAEEAQGEARVLLDQYRRAGENISYEAALDEAAANYAGRMIEDGKVLDDFIEKHRDNRTLLEKVRDAIRSIIAKLTGAERRQAQTAEGKLTAALEASAKQANALQNGGSVVGTEGGYAKVNGKFSLKGVVEDNGDLLALHNLSEGKLLGDLELGGLPMPSIAIVLAQAGHAKYGEISLVFAKETIDPKFFRANKVYGGDAWTPTFPAIEYKVNEKVLRSIRDTVNDLTGGPDARRQIDRFLSLDIDNMTDALNRNGGDPVAAFRDSNGLKYAYLRETDPGYMPPTTSEPLGKRAGHDDGVIIALADTFGADGIRKMREGGYTYFDEHKDIIGKMLDVINNYYREHLNGYDKDLFTDLSFSEFDSLTADAYSYTRNGRKQTVDTNALREYMNQNIDQAAYEAWLERLFDGIVEKKGIRNERDLFTPQGNRRGFDALHYEVTLENIVKAMKNDTQKGGGVLFGGNSIWGVATKDYGSISEIKKDSGRLGNLPDDEYDAIRDGYSQRLADLALEIRDPRAHNSFLATDDAASAIIDTLRKKRTVAAIDKELRTYTQLNIQSDTAEKALALFRDISNMPVGYFEAKPQRAVGFDEVLAAVIPDDSSEKLRTGLERAGVRMLEYKSGDDTDRLAKVNSVEGARFSLKTDSQGRTLTEQQREYFKDSTAVDDQGRLMVMYHGTRKGGFTVFRDWSYLTANRKYAERYMDRDTGETMYEVYANIKKPFDTRLEECRAIWENEFYGEYSRTALQESGLPDWTDGYDLVDFLEENGYDYDAILLDEGADQVNGSIVERGISYVVRSSEQIKSITNENPTSDPDIRYSLKPVPPVRPKSKDWRPGATFDEVKAAHPTLFALDADEADTRNPTQISGTVKSYRKIYDALKAEGFDGTILDASSGLGYGTRAGREEYGFQVDDIEPFPDEKYKPMFTDYSALEKTYDVIINNAVLNVMPQDLRDALVVKMGEMLKPGGRAFINVRGTDVKNASSKVAINDDLMEYFISNTGSYQKGFTQRELVAYLKDALGDGFSVEPTKKFGGVSAIVTRELASYSIKGSETARETAKLREENDLLRERVEYWRGQTRRTKRVTTDKKAVTRAARELIRSYGADLETTDISGDLQSLYDYIASGYDGADELTYTEARRRAEAIARKLVESAVTVDDDMYQQYSDLRSYLRTTKLTISEEDSHNIADYGDFRKRNMGRMMLTKGDTNIDRVYEEMAELWPEFFDPQRETHPADQLTHIADVMDGIYDIEEYNPFSNYMEQAVTGAANEIMEQFFDLPQTRATFADRQARKLEDAKAKGRQQVQKVREQSNTRLEELREQNRQRVQDAIAKERDRRDKQIEKLKTRYREKDAAGRERRNARELRAKIVRHANALSQKLLRPSDKQHIPESLRQATAAALEAINLESAYSVDPATGKRVKDGTGTPTKRTEAFRKLRLAYAEIAKDGGDYTLIIDPDLMDNLNELESMKDTPLMQMGTSQLETVWATIKAVEASIRTANKMLGVSRFETISAFADGIRVDNLTKKDRGNYKGIIGKVDKLVNLDMLTPQGYFHRLGKTGEELFRMMRAAQDRHITIMQQAQEKTAQIIGKTDINKLEREVHTFDLAGGKLKMSTAQVMSLYELMKREQARDHILKGGIRPDTITGGRALREDRRSAPVHVTAEDLATITGVLTDEQIKIADGLQKYMGGELSELGNEASMAVYGYRKFNERNYFPIKVDKNQTKRDISKEAQAATIAGRGFTKSVTPKANNAVMVESIFDTYSAHVNDMATYAAWLPTMENVRRIRDFTFRDEEGNRTGDVKTIIERVFGRNGNAYLNKLVDDINQGVRSNGTGNLTDGIVGNYKAAAVAANIRVILQQPTAILRAMNTLDPKYLLAGTVKRGDWGKVKKYAPIAVWKDWGYFDINTGRQMKDVLLSSDTMMEKVKQAAMAGAGKADSFAWARLWNAVEAETKDKRPGLKPGTDEFYRAVASRFGEIIDGTQVVDGLLQRSQIMRSPDALAKMSTSFMGEPTKTYNMFVNAVYDLRNAEGKDALKKAKRGLARTTTALVVSFAVNAVMQSIVDALRDDDKERDYWEKMLTAYTGFTGDEESFLDYWNSFWDGNLEANFNPMGYLPYFKDMLSIAQGYDVSRMDMEPVSKVWDAAVNMKKALSGEGKYSLAGASANLLAEAARLLGIPVANLKRDIQAGITTAAIETDSYLMQYRIDKAMLNMGYSGNTSNFMDILYNASINDREAYEIIYADMVESGITEDKIRNAMETRMKRDQGVESVADLEARYLTPKQEQSYNSLRQRVTGTSVWSAASAEQREALEEDLYDLTVANSSGLKLQEKIDGGAAYGIDEADYLLYRLALHVVDQPTESGNLGSYTGDEVEAAIDMLTGLDDEARAYLWEAAGKSEKSNPYK